MEEITDGINLAPHTWGGTALIILIALAAGVLAILVIRGLVSLVSRREKWIGRLFGRMGYRWQLFILTVLLWIACAVSAPAREEWWPAVSHVFLIATILGSAWLLSAVTSFGIEGLMGRYDAQGAPSPYARRMRTQLTLLRRLASVVIAVLAVGMVIFTFPEMRAVGASVLASAGVVSIIAGLAAQSTLGNLIAGIQIAFSDAIRVDDVVVVEGEWGRIGEITLSYVVVYVWDERRLILPCTYFTTQPFESWTRHSDKILGTVYFDLDWRVPIDRLREKFMEIVEASPAWDGRSAGVAVTDAVGGVVTVRCVVSSENSGDQWDLRCEVREGIVTWLQREYPEALPVTRVRLESERADREEAPQADHPVPASQG